MKSRHLESIKIALSGCESAGITTGMDVEVAKSTMVELEKEAHKVPNICPFVAAAAAGQIFEDKKMKIPQHFFSRMCFLDLKKKSQQGFFVW